MTCLSTSNGASTLLVAAGSEVRLGKMQHESVKLYSALFLGSEVLLSMPGAAATAMIQTCGSNFVVKFLIIKELKTARQILVLIHGTFHKHILFFNV